MASHPLLESWLPHSQAGSRRDFKAASHEFDVAVIGDNTIDRFLDEPEIGDLVGGNALNVAVQLSMLGVSVRYFGAVGDDKNGGVIRDAMQKRGLDTSGLRTTNGQTALTCVRRGPDGDRFFESESFGVTVDYMPSEEELERIRGAHWVHIGMLPTANEVRSRLYGSHGPVVSQDCSVARGYSSLSVAFISAGESYALAEDLMQEALKGGVHTAVATLGSHGAVARREEEHWRSDGIITDVIDTTGAGDSFMAGFIAAARGGANVSSAMAAGNLRGSFTCKYTGGWPQTPADILKFG